MNETSTYRRCQGTARASCTLRGGKLGAKQGQQQHRVGMELTRERSAMAQELVK